MGHSDYGGKILSLRKFCVDFSSPTNLRYRKNIIRGRLVGNVTMRGTHCTIVRNGHL